MSFDKCVSRPRTCPTSLSSLCRLLVSPHSTLPLHQDNAGSEFYHTKLVLPILGLHVYGITRYALFCLAAVAQSVYEIHLVVTRIFFYYRMVFTYNHLFILLQSLQKDIWVVSRFWLL